MKIFISFLAILAFLNASTVETITENTLITKGTYTLAGTFGAHDFKDADTAFDWAFTLTNGTSYQLQGNAPTQDDVFGWKKVDISAPTPAWYMFALDEDVDGDGSKKFDWVLLSTNMNNKSAYKLKGETKSGTFDYSKKLDIDYSVDENRISIYKRGGSPQNITDEYTSLKTIHSMKKTIIDMDGKDGDHLNVTIEKLPFGTAQDINVSFTLRYSDANPLPTIAIDTDISFDTAVALEFYSTHLSSDAYVFVYQGSDRDYFVPFVKDGSTYSAKLLHFSNYGFDDKPSNESMKNSIEAELEALESYRGDEGIYGLDNNLIGDIVTKINLLENSDAALAAAYMKKLIGIIEDAVDRWMTKMKRTSVPFWDNYCVHKDFVEFLTKLVQTATEMELIGAKSIDADVHSLINYHMKAAYKEWKTLVPPKACAISDMLRYLRCAVKFMTEAEVAGVDISHKEQNEILINYVEGNILYVLTHASCEQLECVKFYLSMSKKHEFEYMGIGHDYTQELEAKVEEIEQKIEDKMCDAPSWFLKIDFVQPEITSGSVIYKNFTIDCDDAIGSDEFYGDECAYLSSPTYTDARTSKDAEVSYSGDLTDPELVPLIIYTSGINFNAQSTSEIGSMAFEQVGSFVWEYEYAHAPQEHCFGNFEADTLANIKAAKISQWTSEHSEGFSYCTFTLKPCKDESCSIY